MTSPCWRRRHNFRSLDDYSSPGRKVANHGCFDSTSAIGGLGRRRDHTGPFRSGYRSSLPHRSRPASQTHPLL
eukprot:9547510-Heterocapsa_arctica.AAC.1